MVTSVLLAATRSLAQPYDVSWYAIAGGGVTFAAQAPYQVGVTIGQSEASPPMASGAYEVVGGFWAGAAVGPTPCYANCDGSTTAPVLTVNDFVCFQALFAAGDSRANCDGSTSAPILTVNDFVCFQAQFAAGCP
jgi:hypothetical protein